jgi:hypothetical protein
MLYTFLFVVLIFLILIHEYLNKLVEMLMMVVVVVVVVVVVLVAFGGDGFLVTTTTFGSLLLTGLGSGILPGHTLS